MAEAERMVFDGWRYAFYRGVRMKAFALAHPKYPSGTNNKSVIYRLQSDTMEPQVHV